MRKLTAFLVLLMLGGLLYAQSYREVKIYVPPLDGIGYIDDMAYFFKKITGEIVMQYRTLGKARVLSDYVITGKVMPIDEVEIEIPPDSEEDENVLFVELFDNAIGEPIGEQYITYSIPDENTENALSVIIYNLLSTIPDVIELYGEEDNWRNKFVYFNPNFLWVPKVYSGTFQSVHISGVGAEFLIDFTVLPFLAIKVGADVTQDWVAIYGNDTTSSDMIINFPIGVAYILRPLTYLMLEPYIGANLNLSLQGRTRPYLFSWMVGFQAGIKTGPGIVVFDPRFSMDFGRSATTYGRNNTPYEYWRYTIQLGVGYKFGFFQR